MMPVSPPQTLSYTDTARQESHGRKHELAIATTFGQ